MDYADVVLKTAKGQIRCRFYEGPPTRNAVIWVGGAGGGWDSPAKGLYSTLSRGLLEEGVSSLRIRYRNPRNLDEAVFDVLAGISFLENQGYTKIGLVGHSLGGAVAIQAAAHSALVRTVVTLATQSHGAEEVGRLASACSILLIHGTEDVVLPSYASEQVFDTAHEPKKLMLLPGNGHLLDESAGEVRSIAKEWIVSKLAGKKRPKQAI
ncbi:MAG: alpha/beta hydrolase [Candidatus Aquicultorales bacterium]